MAFPNVPAAEAPGREAAWGLSNVSVAFGLAVALGIMPVSSLLSIGDGACWQGGAKRPHGGHVTQGAKRWPIPAHAYLKHQIRAGCRILEGFVLSRGWDLGAHTYCGTQVDMSCEVQE